MIGANDKDFQAKVALALNHGLTLQDNVKGGFVEHTTDATPDTESTVIHDLGYVPIGYFILKQDKAGSLFDGATAWTRDKLYVKSDVASLTVRLFVL